MKIKYRPEIDGLRSIAVISVIFYHAQITIFDTKPFKGGFIGVDIFFVISGYLISSIIIKELTTTGSFSFTNFYERRIRRILPAFLFVMLISLPFAWMYLLPGSLIDFSKSIIYSLGFSSNFYFYYSGEQYGAESALLKPFLHTWSLSVEEQYYILFPIFLLLIYRHFRKYLLHILLLILIISLGLADWSSKNFPSVSFYFLHTRVWEMLMGSILAYAEIKRGHRSKNRLFNLIFPSLGLSLIVITIIFFKLYFPHPSFYSLPAILGTCIIIWSSNSKEIITRLLSSKIFVGIGLISYSMYLWHYPIFAFFRINLIPENSLTVICLIILTILLSILTYFFIEQPARKKNLNFTKILIPIFILILIIACFNFSVLNKEGYRNRLPKILYDNLEHSIFKDNIFNEAWKFWYLLKNSEGEICFNNINKCKFNTSFSKKVYLIGDSHSGSIMFDLKNKIIKKNYQFITSVVGACSFYPGFDMIETKTGKKDSLCTNQYFQNLKKDLLKEKDSIIIFFARFPAHFTGLEFGNDKNGEKIRWHRDYIAVGEYDNIQESFKNEVLRLSKQNKIILVYPIPEFNVDPNKAIYLNWINRKNKFSGDFKFEHITISYNDYLQRTASSFNLLDSIENKNIYRVYPQDFFCNTIVKNKCVSNNDRFIFYVDNHHPSLKGSHFINKLILNEIEKIELNINF
jgi:peptidoglycan/LPS O-acetylase OafA/YrhL